MAENNNSSPARMPRRDPYRLTGDTFDARTLEQEMRGRTPFSSEETALRLAQISDALQSAHDSGVIHRDIKPSNIHLGQKDHPFVKALDFGIAKVISSSTAVAASRIAGTVSYMSPEQITGSSINHRSELCSSRCSPACETRHPKDKGP